MRAVFLILMASISLPCAAQDPAEPPYQPHQVSALLQSGDPREVAWGAWLAGRFFLSGAVPLLELAVETRLNNSRGAEPALDIALDALIQLRARPSPALALAIYERRPTQALILMSRLGADGDEALRTVLAKAAGNEWFASANLLDARRVRGFAALVLKDVVLSATVTTPGIGLGSGIGGGVSCGCGASGLMPGYPPWPIYQLSSVAASGLIVLASGPRTVYYDRTVAPAGRTPNPNFCSGAGPTTADRLAFFESFAPSMKDERYVEVSGTDPAADEVQIRQFIDGLQNEYRTFLQDLVNARRLSVEEATSLTPVSIRVRRSNRR